VSPDRTFLYNGYHASGVSSELAKRYYETIDDPASTPADLASLYASDATLRSPREGRFEGRSGVERFYELNGEFFAAGAHDMARFHEDGNVVVAEGTVSGETAAGREYEGIGLADVFEFEDGEIVSHRVYMDYSGIYSELPDEVPDFA
jgi:ketosteroid isomerase-like protein